MNEYVLEMNGITKIFPGVVALDDVTLKVKRGTIHALMEKRCRESTLMKVLMGLHQRQAL